jgi:hypothetical protein
MTGTSAVVILKGYMHSSIQPEFQFEEFICEQNQTYDLLI